jgi:hypothetical protein
MAELLGLVASGAGIAALAGHIGSTIFKLKGAWARIKNAGEEIRYLIEEIEILSDALRRDFHRRLGPYFLVELGNCSGSVQAPAGCSLCAHTILFRLIRRF